MFIFIKRLNRFSAEPPFTSFFSSVKTSANKYILIRGR